MSFKANELSVDNAEPIELYMFTYDGNTYSYTSSANSYTATVDGNSITFNAEYIKRSDNLKLGMSSSTQETCVITVLRTNSVALLYQGAPPEQGTVNIQIFRVHGNESSDYVKIVDGVVSQVRFNGSEAELTITIESVLNRNVPRGRLSYYCQNTIYDSKCKLNEHDWEIIVGVDKLDKLMIKSSTIAGYPDGYFTDGFIKMGNAYRQIRKHEGDTIYIKYPINVADREGSFKICPGCNGIFKTCAERFKNTDHFSGIPYIQPYNAFKNPTGKGAYWVRSDVIVRDNEGNINEG